MPYIFLFYTIYYNTNIQWLPKSSPILMLVLLHAPHRHQKKTISAHPDFIVVKMHKKQHVPGLGYDKYYYIIIKTNAVTYVPPPPPILHRIDEENDEQEENILDCGEGLDKFFAKVPNQDSFLREISGEVITTDNETVNSEIEENEGIKVFTGEYPEKLFMSATGTQKSYPEELKKLGIWTDGMLRVDCDRKLREYFIKLCGSAEKYFATEIHLAESQQICQICQLSSTQNKKDLFVKKVRENSDVTTKNKCTLVKKKMVLPNVSFDQFINSLFTMINLLLHYLLYILYDYI